MAITAVYRKNGLEVLKVSLAGQLFASLDPVYWGVLTDPLTPNGTNVRSDVEGVLGPMRQLGFAKVAIVGSNTVRNATAPEIAAFVTSEATDAGLQDVGAVANWFQTHPRFRRAFKALVRRIVSENNLQSQKWNDYRVQVAAASTLADLKTRVAAMGDLPIRTDAQGLTALMNDISASD